MHLTSLLWTSFNDTVDETGIRTMGLCKTNEASPLLSSDDVTPEQSFPSSNKASFPRTKPVLSPYLGPLLKQSHPIRKRKVQLKSSSHVSPHCLQTSPKCKTWYRTLTSTKHQTLPHNKSSSPCPAGPHIPAGTSTRPTAHLIVTASMG